jgi:hypothetical protein
MSMNNFGFARVRVLALSLALAACGPETADGGLGAGSSAAASSTTHSFNTTTGTLNVDYAGYLSKHDVVFNSPITTAANGPTVATGRVGAQVWNANGLTMQVTGVDNAQQTAFSSGLVNLRTSPAMDTSYGTFQERINLYDGVITTTYDSNRTVTIMGAPNSELLGIHVQDGRSGVSSVTVDLSIWDLSGLPSSSNSMYLDEPSMGTWKTVSTYADSTGAGFSRGQTDANGFGYTLAASVEGASYSASVVSGSTVRLTITPTSSYTIWIANATRKNAPGGDSVSQAKLLLSNAKGAGYATTLASFTSWWHAFWNASFVQYSNGAGDADYLENFYYLAEHIIAGGAYGNYPFQHVHGTYSAKNDGYASQWSGGYWFWNQRDVYHSFLASNHASALDSFYNLYLRNYDALKSHTQSRFGIDGLWVPETIGWDGNARWTDSSTFTDDIYTTGDEAAQWMYYRYKYTNDAAWLARIYPFMREVAKFHAARFSRDGSTGKYYMAKSNSHETYWDVKNALTDLAAVKAYFPMVIEASTALGQDSSLRSQWQTVLSNLQPYPADGNGYLPMDPPVAATHNNENIACELAWPYGVVGVGSSDLSRVVYNWNNRPFPYTEIWSPDAVQAARLGMGDQAFSGMKTMLGKWQAFPNGMTNTWNGVYDVLGTHLSAINESLLQSHTGKIRVFPALPGDSSFAARFTLLASGGFLVSSEREAGEIKYVGLRSLAGKPATVVNPWGTQAVQVRSVADDAIVLSSAASELTFNTAAGGIYVIERTAKLLSSYAYAQLSGTANTSQRTLSGTNVKLGSGTGSPPSGYTLTVARAGSGSGTVTGGGISCGSTCSANLAGGTMVTLTATPATGSTFAGWSGACGGTGTCALTMNTAQAVTASFSGPQPSGISINAGGAASGAFVADAYSSGGSTYSTTSAIDTSLITGAVPPQAVLQSERYGEFTYTVPGLTAGNAYTVTLYLAESYWTAAGQRTFNVAINGAAVLSAFDIFAAAGGANRAISRTFDTTASASGQVVIAFTKGGGPDNPKVCGIAIAASGGGPTTYALDVTRSGTGGGTVAGGPINCGSACSADLASGTTLTLTATAATGSTFAGWSGDCAGTGACSLSMTGARSVGATFNTAGSTSTGRLAGAQSGRCLDVPSASQTNGTKLSIWDCNGGTNQQWTQTSSGTVQVYGSKCLEFPSGTTAAGTQVQIWDCTGGANQQWRFNADGTISSVATGLCLDVTGQGTANGTAVVVWTCTGGANQRWSR